MTGRASNEPPQHWWPADDQDTHSELSTGGQGGRAPVMDASQAHPSQARTPHAPPRTAAPPDRRPRPADAAEVTTPLPKHDAPVPPAPSHAMPERIGVAAPEPEPEQRRRRVRRTGLLATVAAVLVVVLAAGVTLTRADVANRLELPWAPNAPTAPEPEPVAVQRSLVGPDYAGAGPTADGVRAALADVVDNNALGSLSGSVVNPVAGDVLWSADADRPLPPASTTKLLTAAAALLSIDHDSRISTTVVQGEEPGSVVIVGSGDPTLSSLPEGKDSVYPRAAHLDDLVEQVREATGGDVDTVYVDLSAYEGAARAPGWGPRDAPSTYAAPMAPAMLDGGRNQPARRDSPRTGNPSGAVVGEFAKRIGADAGGRGSAPDGARVLGVVHSAPLSELIDVLLADSDNVLAEAVGRQVAMAAGKTPSFDGAAEATLEVLDSAGFDVSDVTLADASGLSADNRIPAELLTEILAAAAAPEGAQERTSKLRPLLGGLPVAGGTGTLASRYGSSAAADGKGWVRAKTGTLSEVNTLAGVVLDSDGGVMVFAFMSSGTSPSAARPALDEVAAALRGCGCR